MSLKSKTTLNLQTQDSIDETYKALGELAPEVAYIASRKTHKVYITSIYYDDLLPVESTDLKIWKDGVKVVRTIQRGNIVNSRLFKAVLDRAFHQELNLTLENVDFPKDIALAAAVTSSLEKTNSKRQKKINANKRKLLEQLGITEEAFEYYLEKGKHLEGDENND